MPVRRVCETPGQANDNGRVDVSEPASISTGIASRYATAIFELAKEAKELDALGNDVEALKSALADSADFRSLIASPVYSRDQQGKAVTAVADKMGLSATFRNTLGLMASKRRLFVLRPFLARLRRLIADEKGVVEAEVTSAVPLSDDQRKRLAKALSDAAGREIKLTTSVDDGLIGGLVVRLGSRMVDTSIRARLAALQTTMKEVR